MSAEGLIRTHDFFTSPAEYTFDDTKPDGSHPAIIGFITGDRARACSNLTSTQRRDLLAESYANAFDSDLALK